LFACGSVSPLPTTANNIANCNTLPFTQDALVTSGGTQCCVWVTGPELTPVVSSRRLPQGDWSPIVDLGRIPGNPFQIPTALDPHNSYAAGVDDRGRLHVVGNLHNQTLRYARSDDAELEEWSFGTMIGLDEASVTYPAFVKHPDGTLLFLYRDGRSGFGDIYANRLPPGSDAWERIGKLIDGKATGESPYLNHAVVSADWTLHLSGCFRGEGRSAATNRDVWHLQGSGAGRSWCSAAGEPLRLPLERQTVPIALPTRPEGSGLVNQTGMDVDPAGRPHIATTLYDSLGATQIIHMYHDGSRWRLRPVTSFKHRMETNAPILDAAVARPAVACTSDFRVWIVFRAAHNGRANFVRCIESRPDDEAVREFVLYGDDLGAWEPSYDTNALRSRDELHLLVTRAPPYTQSRRPSDPSSTEPIAVLSVTLPELIAGAAASSRVLSSPWRDATDDLLL
jgi:hypothetical protein